jgi:hypothetical protein
MFSGVLAGKADLATSLQVSDFLRPDPPFARTPSRNRRCWGSTPGVAVSSYPTGLMERPVTVGSTPAGVCRWAAPQRRCTIVTVVRR